MLDTNSKLQLQSLEGELKDICLKLGVMEAQHIHEDKDARCRKLLKLALAALRELDDGSAAMGMEPSAGSAELDNAVNALAHRMGSYVPPERR